MFPECFSLREQVLFDAPSLLPKKWLLPMIINNSPIISPQTRIIKRANFYFSIDTYFKFSLNLFAQTNPTSCGPAFHPLHCDNISEGVVGLWNVITWPPLHICSLEPGCISQHDPKLQPVVLPESSMKSRNQFEYFGGNLIEGIQYISDERVEKPNRVATAGSY